MSQHRDSSRQSIRRHAIVSDNRNTGQTILNRETCLWINGVRIGHSIDQDKILIVSGGCDRTAVKDDGLDDFPAAWNRSADPGLPWSTV